MHLKRFLVALLVLAACGGPLITRYDARAPDVPYINQYNPSGKDATYDGTEFCGPAVLAGIARVHGQGAGLSDAALIEQLAFVSGTTDNGTTGNGMLAGRGWLGLSTDANPGSDLDWIDGELELGHDVIALGNFYAVPGRENPKLDHFISSAPAGGFTLSAW